MRLSSAFGLAVCALPLTAMAQGGWDAVWSEVGDAGQSIGSAQSPLGTGAIEYIDGELLTGADVDLYRIRISDPHMFYVDSGASFDAQLFLFALSGIGVSAADENAGGGGAVLHGGFVPAVGEYLLAISAYNSDPVDSLGSLIWNDLPRDLERAPDGPGAASPLDHWTSSGPIDGGKYKLYLKGATFVPAPGSVALVTLAFAATLGRRRRAALAR